MPEESSYNVVTYLQRAADRVGDRAALVIESNNGDVQQVSFAELWDQVDRTSVGLRGAGLAPGQRAIIMIPMSIDLYVTLLAVLKLGAVAVFVDPWIGGRQIAAFSAFASPTAYLGIAKSHLLRLMQKPLRSVPLSVTTGPRLWRIPAQRTLKELMTCNGDGCVHSAEANDSALVTFTSGSSGTPKGANRTHGFLSAQHLALQREFPYEDQDIDMPMFPVFALNNLASGITSIVPRMDFRHVAAVDGEVIVNQMRRHHVTTCTASPPFFDRMAEHLASNRDNTSNLRRILTGGAPVSDSQLEAWRRVLPDTEITVVFGSTEAEPVAHIDADERLASANDSLGYCVGVPTTLVRTKLIRISIESVDVTGGWSEWTVGSDEIGELIVAGDHVCKEYFNNTAAARENKIFDSDGTVWHRMGDTGYFDEAGRFWLVGRVHSTIMRDGQAVHPQLLEQAAAGRDERIEQVAAVGLPDEALGNRVVVVVCTKTGDEVARDVSDRLSVAGQPFDKIMTTNKPLPVDPRHNSKIDYGAVRRLLENGEFE